MPGDAMTRTTAAGHPVQPVGADMASEPLERGSGQLHRHTGPPDRHGRRDRRPRRTPVGRAGAGGQRRRAAPSP
jgi:hypothetical protein